MRIEASLVHRSSPAVGCVDSNRSIYFTTCQAVTGSCNMAGSDRTHSKPEATCKTPTTAKMPTSNCGR